MCGITGIAYDNGCLVEQDVLENMTAALAHRGPDDKGIFLKHRTKRINQSNNPDIGFGHRRLSIIDLSEKGRQPMSNEDNTVWITYNGETYNYKDLRKQLTAKGHKFKSDTDTETIIHGYEEYGEEIFNKLNGMFAFALWDNKKQVLYLIRDRYGQKPLYYWCDCNSIVFASELKALIKYPAIKKEIEIENLSRYLAYEYIPAPHTIFKNIYKLLPAHFLRWKDGKARIKPYWRIQINQDKDVLSLSCSLTEKKLLALLKESVKIRLASDVPLGVFLSGGIDSTAIVSLMTELIPSDQIKTFSIGFKEKSFDESNYAREVAEYFGTEHHEQILTPDKMINILPEVCDFMDEPFADASIIPTYLLSKFTRQFVTVALGGDGGDELFAGYDPFLAHIAARYYNKIPGIIHENILIPMLNRLPVSTKNMSFDFKVKQFLKGMPYNTGISNQIWLGAFSKKEQINVFSKDLKHIINGFDPYMDIENACQGIEFRDQIDEIIYLYSRFYLLDDILRKVDSASMATSLEVRSPFLDVNFAEFANSIPSRLKLKRLTRKFILKKSLKNKIPRKNLYRKKKGFGIPLSNWLKKDLKSCLLEVFSPLKIKRDGFFEAKAIEYLLKEHFQGKKDNRKQIWTLFMFEMWKERFV